MAVVFQQRDLHCHGRFALCVTVHLRHVAR